MAETNGHQIEVIRTELLGIRELMNERTRSIAIEVLSQKVDGLAKQIEGNDKQYQQQFSAAKDAIAVGLTGTKGEVAAAFAASEKALLLKSAELERRLEALNGEAARITAILQKSVPREVWEESQKSQEIWKASVDKTLNTTQGKSQQTIYIIGLIIVAIQIGMYFLSK